MKRVWQAREANLDVLRHWMMGFHQERLSTGRAQIAGRFLGDPESR
jgi:hypothetical protein